MTPRWRQRWHNWRRRRRRRRWQAHVQRVLADFLLRRRISGVLAADLERELLDGWRR